MSIVIDDGGLKVTLSDSNAPNPDGRKSADEISRMTPAQKLDYARQFNQKKMPANPYDRKDPRR
jgi:hypothetical protein